ncbi:hypothetical protein Tco_0328967 [Tanacetum coccineum]
MLKTCSHNKQKKQNAVMSNYLEIHDLEVASHPNIFFNPKLINWNWDDVIVIPSDDDEADDQDEIQEPVE